METFSDCVSDGKRKGRKELAPNLKNKCMKKTHDLGKNQGGKNRFDSAPYLRILLKALVTKLLSVRTERFSPNG